MKTALSIVENDCSGGAEIRAGIKAMTMNGVYAMSAVTALTSRNATGVTAIFQAAPAFLKAQLDAVFTDIFPDAVQKLKNYISSTLSAMLDSGNMNHVFDLSGEFSKEVE